MASASQRWRTLEELDEWLRLPMALLGLVWLLLVLAELLGVESALISAASTIIWITFIAEFGLRLLLAPNKLVFVRSNWLTLISLVVPALRFFRALTILRAARALRSLRLVRIVGTANRT